MDLDECKRKGFVRKYKPNKELCRSLIEMSGIKEKSIKDVEFNEINVNAFVPLAYDSLREILEAICIMHGFKVTSHVCIESLLKTLYPDVSFSSFDRFRYIRNSINYYGKQIDFKQGKEMISSIFKTKQEFLKLLKKLL